MTRMANFAIGRKLDTDLIGSNPSSPSKEKIDPMVRLSSIVKEPVKKFLRWFAGSKRFSEQWRIISTPFVYAIESKGGVILSYEDFERKKVIDLIRNIKREAPMMLFDNEAYQIFMAVKRTEHIEGDLAEVGVYRGASAKLICKANGNKTLHLFDTFEGLPAVEAIDQPQFNKGQFASSFDDVKNYLKDHENVYFYKGLFPGTATPVEDKKFSFVHFDVDTYESTRSCLEFFYSRMNRGGIILSHDYISAAGVRRAFDEFFSDKLEPIIEMSGTQCLIVKL
jgi:O-methyltransferase